MQTVHSEPFIKHMYGNCHLHAIGHEQYKPHLILNILLSSCMFRKIWNYTTQCVDDLCTNHWARQKEKMKTLERICRILQTAEGCIKLVSGQALRKDVALLGCSGHTNKWHWLHWLDFFFLAHGKELYVHHLGWPLEPFFMGGKGDQLSFRSLLLPLSWKIRLES